jgi:hypothetical protein
VATDPAKIEDIVNWKTPQTISQLRGFLGLTGYYRRFIPKYAYICQPLHNALKKNSFQWSTEQQNAFDQLKTVMSQPPLLALPDFSLPFAIETDACETGIGAVLMQQSKPLAYYSKSLGPNNAAKSIYEKEAMAILEALRKWRHYFLCNKLIIRTDQSSLKYIASQKLLEGIQHKLMLKLLEFDFSIQYKKGSENSVADALSRKHQPLEHKDEMNLSDTTCTTLSVAVPSWTNEITKSYTGDPECTQLLQELAIDPTSHANYTLHSGVLRYKGRIYIGSSYDLKSKIFASFHSSVFGGHSGIRVTYQKLKHAFFWPKMKQFLTEQIAACPVCQISKTEKIQYPGLLEPLSIPKAKWSEISMDFVEGLPKSKGKDVILVVVDRLTKYAHFLPLSHPYTVQKVAQATLAEKEQMISVLQPNLAKAQKKMKQFADAKRTPRTFELGDMVYLKMQPHREHALGKGNPLKLAAKWYGPFKIIQLVGNRAYKLQLPEGTLLHNVFHVNQLKKHVGDKAVPQPGLPLVTPTGKIKSNPITILQRRQVPRREGAYDVAVPQWLIHWHGLPEAEATWEDALWVQATFPSFKP